MIHTIKKLTYLVFGLLHYIISMLATYSSELATSYGLSAYNVEIIFSIIFRTQLELDFHNTLTLKVYHKTQLWNFYFQIQ